VTGVQTCALPISVRARANPLDGRPAGGTGGDGAKFGSRDFRSSDPKIRKGDHLMGQPTYEQVDLMLKLYELRREPRLREARTWFVDHYSVSSPEEMLKKYPPGSTEDTNIRMTCTYGHLVARLATQGLIGE